MKYFTEWISSNTVQQFNYYSRKTVNEFFFRETWSTCTWIAIAIVACSTFLVSTIISRLVFWYVDRNGSQTKTMVANVNMKQTERGINITPVLNSKLRAYRKSQSTGAGGGGGAEEEEEATTSSPTSSRRRSRSSRSSSNTSSSDASSASSASSNSDSEHDDDDVTVELFHSTTSMEYGGNVMESMEPKKDV